MVNYYWKGRRELQDVTERMTAESSCHPYCLQKKEQGRYTDERLCDDKIQTSERWHRFSANTQPAMAVAGGRSPGPGEHHDPMVKNISEQTAAHGTDCPCWEGCRDQPCTSLPATAEKQKEATSPSILRSSPSAPYCQGLTQRQMEKETFDLQSPAPASQNRAKKKGDSELRADKLISDILRIQHKKKLQNQHKETKRKEN